MRELGLPSWLIGLSALTLLAACSSNWNDPYPGEDPLDNTLYSAFDQRPKHLDPVQSYTEPEAIFLCQIVEPPLQYHYLKRPHEIIPATAVGVPKPAFYDKGGKILPPDADPAAVAFSVYEIKIKPGILYQPHPAFAKTADGAYRYWPMSPEAIGSKRRLADFPETGDRELEAADYVYQIKRLAHPRLHSPILEMMGGYIVGLKDFAKRLDAEVDKLPKDAWLDLDRYDFEGVRRLDKYTYQIKIRGVYPQMRYWLTMHFFSPMPREVDRFFSQPGMDENNLTLDWYPVGTGPYRLVENNPNSRMVLERNPNFRPEYYPTEGEAGDREAGLLVDAGKRVPFIDKIVFVREKESIPYWNKFLQGYYDASGISSPTFDQAIQFSTEGGASLSEAMTAKGIRLLTAVDTNVFYTGFNMLDPIVGGKTDSAQKLRQAISIAYDQEEYNAIFLNGRGLSAQGPIPPGIFGHREGFAGMNPVVYDRIGGKIVRRPIDTAKRLMREAGYPDGRNAKTGAPLILYLDTVGSGLNEKSQLDWMVKQFAKLNIQLSIRSSDFNRFQDKLRNGSIQIYNGMGWNTDYPDPENALFLFDSRQSRVRNQGENTSNYENPQFDAAFDRMKHGENGPDRAAVIDEMLAILRRDSPWIWGFHAKRYTLIHGWLRNRKVGSILPNTIKYQRLDTALRARSRLNWNRPAVAPLIALLAGLIVVAIAGRRFFSVRSHIKPLAAEPLERRQT